ncbi:hypothetical protein [Tunicatimonas pelagia]|uniref:hypothetical protein n=1 Tax=Tunicatimonas pelagia TaxID=931531 RepID=UPI002665F89A|nr:hypothetical protein [Tunicatimonas pelagia]WKN45649.1 hypothetical protein P0M28_11845 [Tunicatimonas pelagia]
MKKQRDIIRIVHLLGAAVIGTYVYSPYSQLAWFTLILQIVIIPALILTGLWLWKPKWFKASRKTATLLLFALMTTASLNPLQAQDRLKGGAGGFTIGVKAYNTAAHQFFVPEGGPTMGDNIVQFGGEGYGLLNRWVLGGSGYMSRGDQVQEGNLQYKVHGGGGFFQAGYVVYHTDELLAFPLLGIGVDALGINRRVEEDIAFAPDRFLEANYFIARPSLDVGVGVDWFPGKKGWKLGIRTGYNVTLARNNEWRHYGGEITTPDLPDNDLDGFYVRLTVGGGHFRTKE